MSHSAGPGRGEDWTAIEVPRALEAAERIGHAVDARIGRGHAAEGLPEQGISIGPTFGDQYRAVARTAATSPHEWGTRDSQESRCPETTDVGSQDLGSMSRIAACPVRIAACPHGSRPVRRRGPHWCSNSGRERGGCNLCLASAADRRRRPTGPGDRRAACPFSSHPAAIGSPCASRRGSYRRIPSRVGSARTADRRAIAVAQPEVAHGRTPYLQDQPPPRKAPGPSSHVAAYFGPHADQE
jgi:hypothetical protein